MPIKTRKPTGKAPWPMLLIAGVEKAGKSYACAKFSASEMVGRTFYIEVGEGAADQYGALPGARYEIVEHDGSYSGILEAVESAVAEPSQPGKPNCIVLDSASELWALLCDEQQAIATKRGKGVITMDQWNAAKRRWRKVIDTLRNSKGPVLITARYEQVTVMVNGRPTTDKEWKVRAEKDLGFEVDGIITMTEPRKPHIAGIRTVAFDVPQGGFTPSNAADFGIEDFMSRLGIDGGERTFIPRKEDPDAYNPAPDAVSPDVVEDDTQEASLTPRQKSALGAQVKRLGLDKDTYLHHATDSAGRAIKGTDELSESEADAFLTTLAAMPGPDDPTEAAKARAMAAAKKPEATS